jgi:hypothetical protein
MMAATDGRRLGLIHDQFAVLDVIAERHGERRRWAFGFLLAVRILSQVEAIERLTREVEALRADNAKLRAKLNLPSKTPENSSTPPSQGHKVSGEERKTPEGKRRNSHAGGTSDKARTL